MRNFIFFICSFFLLMSSTYSQDSILIKKNTPSTWELLKYDGVSAFNGLTTTYTRPLQWKKDDFITAGAIVLGTGALYLIDDDAKKWFGTQEKNVPGVLKDFGWYFGNPQNVYAAHGALYLYGLFTKNEKIRKTGVLLLSAVSTAGLIQTISKTATGRSRPGNNEGKGKFKPFSKEGVYHSFPSGHTILSVTTAYAIAKQFDNPFVKAGIYGVGMITPLSRIWAGAHWLSDVGLSIAISVLVVETIDSYLNKERDYGKKPQNKISWKLNVGLGQAGITGSF